MDEVGIYTGYWPLDSVSGLLRIILNWSPSLSICKYLGGRYSIGIVYVKSS